MQGDRRGVKAAEEEMEQTLQRNLEDCEKTLLLQRLDDLWTKYLIEAEHLRLNSQMRSASGLNPVDEFKFEAGGETREPTCWQCFA